MLLGSPAEAGAAGRDPGGRRSSRESRSVARRRAHGQRAHRPGGDRPRRLLVRLDAAGQSAAPPHRRPTASWCGAPTRATAARCGTAARWQSARQAFVAYAGPPLAADAAYRWTVQARGAGGAVGPGLSPGTLHHGPAAGRLDRRPLAAPGRRLAATRPGHLPADRGHAAGGHRGARHGLRLRRPHLPPVRGRDAGGRLAELLLPRRAVRARRGPHRRAHRGRHSAIGVLHRWYGPGQGPARLLPRPAPPALRPVRRRPPRRLRVRRDMAGAAGRVAAVAAAQRRRRRLRGVGGRARSTRRAGRARASTTARGRPSR